MSARDLIIILPIILAIGITVVASQKVLNEFDNVNEDVGINQDYVDAGNTALGVFGFGIVATTTFFYLSAIILAFRIRASPIFIVPSFILGVISLILSAEFANMWWKFANMTGLSAAANSFPLMVSMFKNLPFIAAGFWILLMITMYGKSRSDMVEVGI